MTDDEYVKELSEMHPEQLAMLDRLVELGKAAGLSPDEIADLWERVYAAAESGKSMEETKAIIMGKH
jgi:hypothetical protein